MSPPLWVVEAADMFWRDAGEPAAFPRDVRRAVARTLPVAIVLLSVLHVAEAATWLRRQGIAADFGAHDRALRACLVAQAGSAIIFVDGEDAEAEQRYSIAHELAHFLRDYLRPRQAAVAQLGPAVLEVLDGLRPARAEERAAGVLTRVPVRRHVHLMGRGEEDDRACAVAQSESAADALALELLAPWAVVSADMGELGIARDRVALVQLLATRYGLPAAPARHYVGLLCPEEPAPSPLLRQLRAQL